MKQQIHIKESVLKSIIMESVKKALYESLNCIMVTYDSPTKGRNQLMAKSLQDAQRLIPSDATYFDITQGCDSSNSDSLISWGGKGGYWDNATNPDFKWGEKPKQRELDSILRKRKF